MLVITEKSGFFTMKDLCALYQLCIAGEAIATATGAPVNFGTAVTESAEWDYPFVDSLWNEYWVNEYAQIRHWIEKTVTEVSKNNSWGWASSRSPWVTFPFGVPEDIAPGIMAPANFRTRWVWAVRSFSCGDQNHKVLEIEEEI